MKTKVVFRKFNDGGDIIAIFPRVPGTSSGYDCMSYQHNGQHGVADPAIVSITTLATPNECVSLRWELKALGYDLDIRTKMTYKDQLHRMAEIKQQRTDNRVTA